MSNKMSNKASPSEVANFFLVKAKNEKKPITIMKLLKLVYIGYGWCIAILREPIFDEPIQAWKFGPVIPSLYHEFKSYGPKPIDRLSANIHFNSLDDDVEYIEVPIIENEEIIKVLNKVWNHYKDYTAIQLSNITHRPNSPWSFAYAQSKNTINPALNNDEIEKISRKKILEIIDCEKNGIYR